MGNPAGSFIWYELMTTDPNAASAFYGSVVGWKIGGPSAPEMSGGQDYRMIERSDGGLAGGVFKLTDEMCKGGAQPCWMPYLYVTDVDAKVTAIETEGGKVQMPAVDLPVGRIAMIADPQGVPIYLMTPNPPPGQEDADSDVFSPTEPQRVTWNELTSPDQKGSMAFYSKHFDFEFSESMPLGEMGDYWFIGHHGQTLGAIMQRQNEEQPAMWLPYIRVPSIIAADAAVKANGGSVMMDPMEVPGGDWIIIAADPQGAGFGLAGAKGD